MGIFWNYKTGGFEHNYQKVYFSDFFGYCKNSCFHLACMWTNSQENQYILRYKLLVMTMVLSLHFLPNKNLRDLSKKTKKYLCLRVHCTSTKKWMAIYHLDGRNVRICFVRTSPHRWKIVVDCFCRYRAFSVIRQNILIMDKNNKYIRWLSNTKHSLYLT